MFGGVRRGIDAKCILFGFSELARSRGAGFKEFRSALGGLVVTVCCQLAVTACVQGVDFDRIAVDVAGQTKVRGCHQGVMEIAVTSFFSPA